MQSISRVARGRLALGRFLIEAALGKGGVDAAELLEVTVIFFGDQV